VVGVDIGMCAVKLKGVTSSRLHGKLVELRNPIERSVPVGFDESSASFDHGDFPFRLKWCRRKSRV
jgi:hypothetical protein